MAFIDLRHVTKIFEDRRRRRKVTALQDLSCDVEKGEFFCLLGPSGCGKSTVLNLIAGFEAPTSGGVSVGSVPIKAPGPERGVVFQTPALYPWLSILDNITLGPKIRGQSASGYLPRARQFMQIMGLQGFEAHSPYELSGGMQQRVAIARILMNVPEVMLMDEPFGALDAQTRSVMQEFLLEVWDVTRPTVVFITHDVEEAIFLADRIDIMTCRPGRIKTEIKIGLPRPRRQNVVTSSEFTRLKSIALEAIREESLRAARADIN